MAAITFKGFRGAVPRSGERLQQPRFAKAAKNIKITSGTIVPLSGLLPAATVLMDAIQTIWRYRRISDGTTSDNWLTFAADTDIEGSLIADDADGRIYWTSSAHDPRMSVFASAIAGAGPYPAAWYMLGVPNPVSKPAVSVTGGSGTNVTRSYAYTFVTALGEESGPSPASDLDTGYPNGTWAITGMQTAPPNSGAASVWAAQPNGRMRVTLDTVIGMEVGTCLDMTYEFTISGPGGSGSTITEVETQRLVAVYPGTNEVEYVRGAYTLGSGATLDWARSSPVNTASMKKRIYRTEGAAAAFLLVAEIDVATTSYNDSAVVLTGELIQTLNTLPPPPKMTCLISLPNGCLVGLNGNELCFSDPYMPYSWPVGNRYSFVGRGVALCPVGNSVIVLTEGFPILFSGSDPEAMSPTVMETYAPCVAKRGAVPVGGGMLYPSHDGLWLASAGGVTLMTRALYRVDEWRELNPETFDAAFHDGQYYASYIDDGGKKQVVVLDIAELDSAVTVDDFADALYRNDYDGTLYAVQGAKILKWDSDDQRRYLTEWTSVEVQLDQPRNFSHAQVHANYKQVVPPDTSILEANQALIAAGPDAVGGHFLSDEFLAFELNGSNLRPYHPPTERKVQFILFDGDTALFARNIDSARPFRLPGGYKTEALRVGINASIQVYSATIAESTAELAQASQ